MDQTLDLPSLWTAVVKRVVPPSHPGPDRALLSRSRLDSVSHDTAVVAVPNGMAQSILESRHETSIQNTLGNLLGWPVTLSVRLDPSLDDFDMTPTLDFPDDPTATGSTGPIERPVPAPIVRIDVSERPALHRPGLNPRYTFDTFVAGPSNRFAHAAAYAVAEQPARNYNPLVVYGESGLGKTHLLHAIGNYTQEWYPGTRVRYVSSEEFTNEFINAVRAGEARQFQRQYRDVDVLLVDDIQFLAGKTGTQVEFFHTFNALHNANKQIVLTCDIAPGNLKDFDERMRTRFGWGLTTDVQPPDLETRIAILRRKTNSEGIAVPPEVLEYIASRISRNIRELEGALIRVTAFASLSKRPVDLALAEEVLRNVIPTGTGPEITAHAIMIEAAKFYSITYDELTGPSRSRTLVTARQVAMYLCRELTDLSLPKIGELFGGRDHTTVMHAERKIRKLMAERRSLYNSVTDLTTRIRSSAGASH